MTEPVTPTDQDDPLPPDEEPVPEIEEGADMGVRRPEPTEDPDPDLDA